MNNEMLNFIVVEGVDGSGKSTTARLLAASKNCPYIKTPSLNFQKKRKFYDSPHCSVSERFDFYFRGLESSVEDIKQSLKKNSTVIVDRYTLSLGIYHSVMGHSDIYIDKVLNSEFPEPKLHIILTPPFSTIEKRIKTRKEYRTDSHIEKNIDILKKVYELFAKLELPNIIRIDSETSTINEVVQKCCYLIK